MNVIVVGGGLFGSVITKVLRSRGVEVTVIDSDDKLAGWKAAGIVLVPSRIPMTLNAAIRKEYDPESTYTKPERTAGVNLLRALYPGHRAVELVSDNALRTVPAYVFSPAEVIVEPDIDGEVVQVQGNMVMVKYANGDMQAFPADAVIVAAGYQTKKLLPALDIVPRVGVSFVWPGQLRNEAFDRMKYPGEAIVGINQNRFEAWGEDGIRAAPHLLKPEREARTKERIAARLGLNPEEAIRRNIGVRPQVKGCPRGLVKELEPGLWVSTGGCAQGIFMAALHAVVIAEALAPQPN